VSDKFVFSVKTAAVHRARVTVRLQRWDRRSRLVRFVASE